ncbi:MULTISPECIES: KpsF/GutQ family sugar-phosphate isomerase [Halopseudomonas]|jgi:arabinose-5-phosphate isomerase|uniref:Arabinose 5-phosphate isomerase n=1 Tax=Halopseudomonas aestusnigri TaxID=857252 RepID=A0AAQ1JNF4_9GAMM|nr:MULTISPECIES: KpsF/GutQ family sugar-phosphate isomerase [Halopseudomonas]OWL90839.1 D-arabinose 5-phosphate isomerase [Halopseudomonas aestusnigri]BDX18926.1 arabinose 5-phosphate isomerase KdsD [Halopseudomonas aestusnigri]GMQ55429.1 arabinose-5-phosphate isomerase KdsD [Halopseudomonas aestusnigri]SEF46564.1 arabinose-5-phosphate isomerase [Halopseudomonas aestusnigri]
MADFDYIASASRTISMERDAVDSLLQRLAEPFTIACDTLLQCRGRVVVTGMGKSGHVGRKLAATLASTGTPAFFVHPGEASHGDMGMITAEDVVIALSNSGNTAEVVTLLPLIKRLGAPLISMTGNPQSTLALAAVANLDTGVEQEACPLNLAPTSSTTTALVMGDALAIALLEARGFSAEDFAFSHPGGSLGRRLLLLVDDIMHAGGSMPLVKPNAPLRDALLEMTRKGLGLTGVIDADGKLAGIFTDGDLRRSLDHNIDFQRASISDVMTRHCKTARSGMLAAEALKIMEDARINGLFVVDTEGRPVGALNMHDLLRAGVV